MLMRQKTKVTHFSSEDSKNTDDSLGSSIEIEEYNAQNNNGNKFNQLRETMNQIFLANPELAEEIKFEKYLTDEGEPEPFRHFSSLPPSPVKKSVMASGSSDPYSGMLEDQGTELTSGKFWSAISKEMTKPQKNSKLPSLNQINHILNIFKTTFEKPDVTSFSPVKPSSAQKKSKSEFRIQSAKLPNDKQGSATKAKDVKAQTYQSGMSSPQYNSVGIPDNAEDGLKYYSFRNKMHLKLKQKRVQRQIEEQKKKKEMQAEKEKLAQEMEQRQMNANLAELEKGIIVAKGEGDDHGEASARNTVKTNKVRNNSRKNSVKPKGDIFERLTKDMTKVPEEEEEPQTKRTFTSQFAQTLYKDMKAFGDTEAFKKVAQSRIINYKKEFKEKLAKQKQFPTDALRFNKNKSRYLNMFVPDFEKTVPIQNKEAIFVLNEVQKESEEWKENPEHEILAKLKKIKGGNVLEFWQEMKDIINQ